jgi:hypothetical protein
MRDTIGQLIVDTFHHRRGTQGPKRRILLTAPHAAAIAEPLDDPCTKSIANALDVNVREHLYLPCQTYIATQGRTYPRPADQNRLWSIPLVNDVAKGVMEHANKNDGNLSDTIHIDVHSFTVTDTANTNNELPSGWGTGLNILTLFGDESQLEMAQRMKRSIDNALCNVKCYKGNKMPETTVVMHTSFPQSVCDDESNAMIEIARYYGAMSVLIEFPTRLNERNVYETTCPESKLVSAVIQALGDEVCFSKRATQ